MSNQIAAPMPKEDAEGLSRPVASMVVAQTPAPRAFNISAIASATTAPAMTAPHDIREGSEGAPSGTLAVVIELSETRVCILGSFFDAIARQGGAFGVQDHFENDPDRDA